MNETFAETDRLTQVRIDDEGLPAITPEIEQERRVAIFDLLENNRFAIAPRKEKLPLAGPYRLTLSMIGGRIVFDINTENHEKAAEFHLSMSPFKQTIKDYFGICQSYFEAVKRLPASRIEAIDMGRRGIHDEGARLLRERLAGKAIVDKATARRLFTLVCVLQTQR